MHYTYSLFTDMFTVVLFTFRYASLCCYLLRVSLWVLDLRGGRPLCVSLWVLDLRGGSPLCVSLWVLDLRGGSPLLFQPYYNLYILPFG